MSSHHVVRDNQEPAIILQNVRFEDYPLVMNLLEWSPFVVLFDSAFELVSSWGVKVDLLVSEDNPEQLAAYEERLEDQKPFIVKHFDFHEMMRFLKDKGHTMINYLGRPSQVMSYFIDFEIVVFDQGYQYSYFDKVFEKWYPKGEFLEFIDIDNVEFLSHDLLDQDYQTVQDGLVTINSSKSFLIKEKW